MPVICKVCNKIFGLQKNFNQYVRNVHQMKATAVSYDCTVHNSKCLEEGCNSSFRNIQDLRNHLQNTHNVTFPKEELHFEHLDESRTWLSNISPSDNVRYLKNNTRSSLSNSETIYFFCNRGRQTFKMLPPNAIRKRKLKSRGTCKMGVACISTIRVIRCLRTNKRSVLFFKTHYGHTVDLQHIHLLPEDRMIVATKLATGVTVSRILRSNRENIGATPLKRVDMLTREDLKNVKKSFNININEGVRHENDVISIDLWIYDLMKTDRSVVMYKKQGDIEPIISGNYKNRKFNENDFILIFLNDSQQNMLKSFGQNIICVDSTHGLNGYDFELTSMLIIDDFGEGFPVAFMFTNRKDKMIFEVFFEQAKSKVSTVSTNVFTSDITHIIVSQAL